jgi:two-component system, response regulator
MISNKEILLVEDNPDEEVLTLQALTKSELPNRIVVVRDGSEALDWLFGSGQYAARHSPLLPQIVLLDLKLPKVDGLEVLRQIRANPRTHLLPVIIFSSSEEEKDLINSYSQGANSYIRKPVDFDQFVSTIQQLSFYWLALNEAPPALQE